MRQFATRAWPLATHKNEQWLVARQKPLVLHTAHEAEREREKENQVIWAHFFLSFSLLMPAVKHFRVYNASPDLGERARKKERKRVGVREGERERERETEAQKKKSERQVKSVQLSLALPECKAATDEQLSVTNNVTMLTEN